MADVGTYSNPAVFQINSDYYLIAGKSDGNFDGYIWNGSGWTSNSTIISGLEDVGARSAPALFQINSDYYLIAGENDGVFNGYISQ